MDVGRNGNRHRTDVQRKLVERRTKVGRTSDESRTNVECNGRMAEQPVTVIDCDVTTDECDSLQHNGWRHNRCIVVNTALQIAGRFVVMADDNRCVLQLATLQIMALQIVGL
jgi:hypothetical protein